MFSKIIGGNKILEPKDCLHATICSQKNFTTGFICTVYMYDTFSYIEYEIAAYENNFFTHQIYY